MGDSAESIPADSRRIGCVQLKEPAARVQRVGRLTVTALKRP